MSSSTAQCGACAGSCSLLGVCVCLVGVLVPRSCTASSFSYEIVVVDDGSRDGTGDLVMTYVDKHGSDRIRLLTLSPNQGKGAAIRKVRYTTPRIMPLSHRCAVCVEGRDVPCSTLCMCSEVFDSLWCLVLVHTSSCIHCC